MPIFFARSTAIAAACIAGDRAEAVGAFDDEGRGAIVNELGLRLGVDLAALDDVQVIRQARDAVTVDAAQIGPHQSVGHDAGVLLARALRHEHVADEAAIAPRG